MRYTIDFDDDQKLELERDISNVLNYSGAYDALYKLLVDRHAVMLHTDMENLAVDLEEFIYEWTKVERYD